jgi:chromosome segregation ATPase
MKREIMSEDAIEAAEAAVEAPALPEAFAEESAPNPVYTAEDIAKARAQEKDKLYGTLDKMKEELNTLRKEREEAAAKEAERKAQRAAREAELQKKKQEEAEASLEVRDLLKQKEADWEAKLAEERAERERAFSLLEKEREFQELSAFRQQRLEQERENIIPELIDLIQGNNRDEIEQSILALKEKSSRIFDSVASASQQTRKEMVGARITAPSSGPLDNDPAQILNSPDDLRNMSMADYAKNRAKLLGSGSNNRGQGLFG